MTFTSNNSVHGESISCHYCPSRHKCQFQDDESFQCWLKDITTSIIVYGAVSSKEFIIPFCTVGAIRLINVKWKQEGRNWRFCWRHMSLKAYKLSEKSNVVPETLREKGVKKREVHCCRQIHGISYRSKLSLNNYLSACNYAEGKPCLVVFYGESLLSKITMW